MLFHGFGCQTATNAYGAGEQYDMYDSNLGFGEGYGEGSGAGYRNGGGQGIGHVGWSIL